MESSRAKERTKLWNPSELQGTRFVKHWLTAHQALIHVCVVVTFPWYVPVLHTLP